MRRGVAFVPLGVTLAVWVLPSSAASHLSMDMPGLGGAALASPSFVLLVTTLLAALLQGAWLLHGPTRARDVGAALALAPLAVSGLRASSLTLSGDVAARIAEVGHAGGEHMWALLATLGLAVGFGAARVLEIESTSRAPSENARAALALVLGLPFVASILGTSTGIDGVSAWIRWGGCGLALLVCAAGARHEASRVHGGVTFALAVALALLAEREYVEALAHDALAHRDPFDPVVRWAAGVREIAIAVEPRERYGPILALLPWVALLPGVGWRARWPRVAAGLVSIGIGLLAGTAISSRLDASALEASTARPRAHAEPDEIRWSARVLPRTAPWLRAMQPAAAPLPPEASPVRCAAWSAPAPTDG